MARLILHLVLSLLLAFGGLPAAAHDHRMANPVAASVAADAEADGGSCHGELANTSDKAPFAPCCGGPDCQCGCLLPVALTGGVATALTRAHVPDPPQPAVRVPAASREPLLRPPSAADAS